MGNGEKWCLMMKMVILMHWWVKGDAVQGGAGLGLVGGPGGYEKDCDVNGVVLCTPRVRME